MDKHTAAEAAIATPDAIELLRSGVPAASVYATLWPRGRADLTPAAFAEIARALDVAAATALPPEDLTPALDQAEQDLLAARASIVQAIGDGKDQDADGNFDKSPHDALCKNAEALLKFQAFRQERQVHRYNLQVARERARLQLLGGDEGAAS